MRHYFLFFQCLFALLLPIAVHADTESGAIYLNASYEQVFPAGRTFDTVVRIGNRAALDKLEIELTPHADSRISNVGLTEFWLVERGDNRYVAFTVEPAATAIAYVTVTAWALSSDGEEHRAMRTIRYASEEAEYPPRDYSATEILYPATARPQ